MTSISDDFNRADESLTAGPWAVSGGTWIVQSNEVHCTSASGDVWARHTSALDSNDQRVEFRWDSGVMGALARASSDLQTGYYMAIYSGGIQDFWRISGGSGTFIASGFVTVNAGNTVYLEVEGSTLRAGVVGGGEVSTTDTNITTGTFAGFFSQQGSNADNWTAEDLGGEPPVVPKLYVVQSNLRLG